MVNIRQATAVDMVRLQQCNILNLPENYNYMYYVYHSVSWPHLLFLAEDDSGKVVGYVLAKLEDEENDKNKAKMAAEGSAYRPEAHITSLSVLRTHRKLGLATKLMRVAHYQMMNVYGCGACSLRVRVTNRAAFTLYKTVLGYTVHGTDESYYADKEDAYDMRVEFNHSKEDPDAEAKETAILDGATAGADGNIQLAESSGKKIEKKVDEKESKASETEADSVVSKVAEKNRKKREKLKAKKAAAAKTETEVKE